MSPPGLHPAISGPDTVVILLLAKRALKMLHQLGYLPAEDR